MTYELVSTFYMRCYTFVFLRRLLNLEKYKKYLITVFSSSLSLPLFSLSKFWHLYEYFPTSHLILCLRILLPDLSASLNLGQFPLTRQPTPLSTFFPHFKRKLNHQSWRWKQYMNSYSYLSLFWNSFCRFRRLYHGPHILRSELVNIFDLLMSSVVSMLFFLF